MPQVDLEALVSVCGGGSNDRKIACETLAGDNLPPEEHDAPEIPPDFPPDSFWLSKDAELDWFDRNAFYERKDSTKGNSNSTNLNPNLNPSSNSSSQRFLKSKASIIGLPKPQKSCFADAKFRRNCRPPNIQLFPKRAQPAGKPAVPMTEPSSPKVSCMGRVRSKRDKSRRLRTRQGSTERKAEKEKPAERRKKGMWTSFRSIFRSGGRQEPGKGVKIDKPSTESPPRKSVTVKARDDTTIEPVAEPPGLGGMMKFASGRRSDAWDAVGDENGEMVNVDVTKSPPGLGGMMKFESGRRSDAWGDAVGDENGEMVNVDVTKSPPGLGGMMKFASGRRSDAWGNAIGDENGEMVNVDETKSEPLDRGSVNRR